MIEDNDVCLLWDRDNSVGPGDSGVNYAGSATTQDGGEGGYGSLGMVFASGAPPPSAPPIFSSVSIFVSKREAIHRGQSMSYSVWLGSIPAMGPGDFEVEPGTVTYNFPDDGWRGGLWLRTHCTTDNHGFFSCLTGDCGSEVQSCRPSPSSTSSTSAATTPSTPTTSVSLVHGFNVPAMVYPQSSSCQPTGCPADINAICPSDLRVKDSSPGTPSPATAPATPTETRSYAASTTTAAAPSANLRRRRRPSCRRALWRAHGRTMAGPSDFNIPLCPKVLGLFWIDQLIILVQLL
ncbi:hypothetical protein BHM03_00021573 [Ensete ventricosum]|nr:hypothetical protein BHM03_00021573 [Ensete ventricosum]